MYITVLGLLIGGAAALKNEEKLLAMAHSMVEEGLVEAGYNSIIFDDCFTKKERGNNSELLEGGTQSTSSLPVY